MIRSSRRLAATLGAVTIAGTAGLTALAPAASAAAVTYNVACKTPLGNADGTQELTLTMPAEKPKPGGEATIRVKMGQSPATSPVTLPPQPFDVLFNLTGSGGFAGALQLKGVPGTVTLKQGEPVTLPEFDAKLAIPASATGDIVLTPKAGAQDETASWVTTAAGTKTYCNVTGTPGALATVPVDTTSPPDPSVSVDPGTQEPGKDVTLNGANWAASATVDKIELCKTDLSGCDATKLNVVGKAVDEQGKLTAAVTVGASVTEGDYKVQVTAGSQHAAGALTVRKPVTPAGPAASLSPTSGPVGTKVTVTGTNWGGGKTVQLIGFTAAGDHEASSDAPVEVQTAADGSFSGSITVNDAATIGIGVARKDTPTIFKELPFSVVAIGTGDATLKGGLARVEYTCKTESVIPVADIKSTMDITVDVPASAKAGDKVNVKATFKNNVVGKMPDINGMKDIPLKVTPTLKFKVTDDAGKGGSALSMTTPEQEFNLVPGGNMTAGPFNSDYTVTDKGTWTFAPDTLTLSTVAVGVTSTTTCSVDKITWNPTGEIPTTGGNAASGGNLAKTGSGGDTLGAFALIAGTAVLGAMGVILLVPYRRRLRTRG